MDGSVMWIVYESSDENGVTLSPRTSDGHVEPSFDNSIDCVLVEGTGYHNGINETSGTHYYSANVRCKNVTTFGDGDGKLEFSNAKQPFIYAWGPTDDTIASASKSAHIKRHEAYGNFWMDMTKATSNQTSMVSVPNGAVLSTTNNAGGDEKAESDGDKVGPAHAVIMIVAFLVIFPLGAVLLRFLESVKIHGIVQGVGVITAVVGSKDFTSGHQVFGLILFALLFLQWGLGLYHHLRFRKHQRPTIYGCIHLIAGPAIVLGGIINGFIGFNFSGDPRNNIYYGIAVAVILIVVLGLLSWKRWSKRKQSKIDWSKGPDGSNKDSYGLNLVPGSNDMR
ncbi:unnamed protein product [Alternaria alternata]